MSEKLDGVRALWDGKGNLISRNGKIFKSPKSFTDSLPKGIQLDGELYIDRGMFSDVVSVIRTRPDNWGMIKYKVFDCICPKMKNLKFSQRLEFCYSIPHISVIPHSILSEHYLNEIHNTLSTVMMEGGEGLVIRDPNSKFFPGRKSSSVSPILKIKMHQDDEAKVIACNWIPITRKGSMIVEDRFGKIFKIGSGLRSSEPPPTVGSVISFAYNTRNESTGIPRFPRYIRKRLDWEYVVH